MKRSWLNWKTLVVIAVGLVILGPLIRGLISIGRSQLGAVQTASPAPAETRAPASAVPTPTGRPARANAGKTTTVNVEGRNIPSESLPTVILNPGLVMPGTKVGVLGFGFDPGGVVDVLLKKSSADSGTAVSMVKVDERGAFSATFTVPERLGTRSPTVLARERGSNKLAQARATVPAGMASAKLGKQVGKPGDIISVSASGFEPDENVKVYWGQLTGDPATTLHADGGGNVGQASLQIPVGAVGNSNIVLVGSRSQAIAIAQFIMLGLYPTVKVQPYAVKAANRIGLSAKGFGPGERVLVYVNALDGPPLMTVQADEQGAFSGAGFVVPFGLKRQQSLILIGEQSRAVVNSGFIVLPYTPTTQPSTYGGFPGTTLSFYASGFAPNEVVLVYKNRTLDGHGQLISAFRVDDRGRAAAAGQYRIPSEDQGKVTFTTVGRQSQGVATATVTVQHSDVPVEIPAQPKYTLPPDLQEPTPSARPSASPSSGPPVGTEASPSSGPPVGTEAPTPSPAASGP